MKNWFINGQNTMSKKFERNKIKVKNDTLILVTYSLGAIFIIANNDSYIYMTQ